MSENSRSELIAAELKRLIRGCKKCSAGGLCNTMQVVGTCPFFRRVNSDGKEKESVG